MRFAAWFGVLVAVLIVGEWIFFLSTGSVPELEDAPREIAFHIAAEFVMALVLLAGSIGLLRRCSWGAPVYLVGAGTVIYSVVNSSGYFAQRDDWALVAMFTVLLVLTVGAAAVVIRALQRGRGS